MTADVQLIHGDALDVLRADVLGYPHALGYHPPRIPDASIDAIVTDPPYGLGFMGKEWDSGKTFVERKPARRNTFDHVGGNHNPADSADSQRTKLREGRAFGAWCQEWAAECLRVLKPGGHLVAFGGTRTVHRLTTGIEDAGFEIRDGIDWLYGSGFPKSLDVSKAIDKAAGAPREVVGRYVPPNGKAWNLANDTAPTGYKDDLGPRSASMDITAPATEDAARWQGWGTALKPAREPIVVARKPLAGTVAANVLAYGTGALNIDACRVPAAEVGAPRGERRADEADWRFRGGSSGSGATSAAGRWPTNVVLSHPPLLDDAGDVVGDACAAGCVPGCPVAELDAQSGRSTSRAGAPRAGAKGDGWRMRATGTEYDDAGGASRFFPVFRYQAKAPSRERPRVDGVAHPTVKPVDLMRWLVRLVCPPGGTVLDLFAGSGTTGEACRVEGFPVVLIEREADYLPLIDARLARHAQAALL